MKAFQSWRAIFENFKKFKQSLIWGGGLHLKTLDFPPPPKKKRSKREGRKGERREVRRERGEERTLFGYYDNSIPSITIDNQN